MFNRTITIAYAVFVTVFLLCGSSQADQYQEAIDASERGDYVTAIRIIRFLAEEGHDKAQNSLGVYYVKGQGVPQNYNEAANWFRRAAEQGNATAQYNLGFLYAGGKGVTQSYKIAAKWFHQAAEQRHENAQVYLGILYADGKGVTRNYMESAKWFLRAAEQGNSRAQLELGKIFIEGQVVPQDYVEAHMWFNLAAAKGNDRARKYRDNIANYMTPAQLAEAQKRARNFRPVSEEAVSRNQNAPSTLQITSSGTGFFVSKEGYIMTNEHVVMECQAIQVRLPGGNAISADILHVNTNPDLAIIIVNPSLAGRDMGWTGQVANFRSGESPRLGEGVVVYGFPLAGALASNGNLTTGNISASAGLKDDISLYQISAPVQPGNSGGPLFDENGQVVGIVVGKLNTIWVAEATGDISQNINFAVKGVIATNFLDLYRIPYKSSVIQSQKRLTAADIAENAQRFTVRVECLK